MDELKARLDKYLKKAEPAFGDITAVGAGGDKVKDTALRYFSDARHFRETGEIVNAFAALEYAEGWLDAGVVLGAVTAAGKSPKDY
jgi:uncharacterized protein